MRRDFARPRIAWRRSGLAVSFALAIGLCFGRTSAADGADPSVERKIQAACLINFARYVEWPSSAFPTPETPLCIGILGDDPYGAFLDDAAKGVAIGHRPVTIRRAQTVEAMRDCHVVFIGAPDPVQWSRHLTGLNGLPILSVSDALSFAQRGGMVEFFLERDHVRFAINRTVAERTGLKVNAQLLRLARIVGGEP
jgi:hypothetical protein